MPPSAEIPVIDIAAEGVSEKEIAKALVDAAAEQGFIYIKSTGQALPSKKLFKETPLEEKKRCTIQTNNRGWSGMYSETLDPKNQKSGDTKEAFNFGEFKDGKAQQPLPSTLASLEPEVAKFFEHCSSLCQRILYLLGLGLEVSPADFFSSAHTQENGASGTILRLLYYPAPSDAPVDDTSIRAGAHSDYGSITLLFRLKGQAGLEILTPSETWAPVPVVPPGTENDPSPPILVNIGDLLSYWTNGLFRSTVHRVTVPTMTASMSGTVSSPSEMVAGEAAGERYSIAFFCHPIGDTRLEPVPSRRVQKFVDPKVGEGFNPYAQRKVLTADEHLMMRLRASYKGLYEEKV
ncbi:hypothetical protein TD95_003458 [Thielaviopsis punctulata]|uniref:Fe2OG dioxygenase domain-containing protein n=1 Tax=Thielaviopsis punctulata TaxID=72032 RepID=A0A0F4ZHJ1_9PEZI|nr:hypothetical protein TD95_003458 [Thielaviopsis punctulata]